MRVRRTSAGRCRLGPNIPTEPKGFSAEPSGGLLEWRCGPVAQWIEPGTPKPLVGGSIPSGPATLHQPRGLYVSPSPEHDQKAPAHPQPESIDAFLLTKQIAGCTSTTLKAYRWWLDQLAVFTNEPTALTMRTFFARLQERGLSPSRQHQAYRTLKTFFRWCVETGVLKDTPLRGFTMRTPKTLPQVPSDDDLRAVLAACPKTVEGIRNRAMLLVLADAGLRASELLRLLVEDWRAADRGLFVRSGKGRKDRVAFICPTTTRALKTWLSRHSSPAPE